MPQDRASCFFKLTVTDNRCVLSDCVFVAVADAMTVISFLKTFGLEQHFKVRFHCRFVVVCVICVSIGDECLCVVMKCEFVSCYMCQMQGHRSWAVGVLNLVKICRRGQSKF